MEDVIFVMCNDKDGMKKLRQSILFADDGYFAISRVELAENKESNLIEWMNYKENENEIMDLMDFATECYCRNEGTELVICIRGTR